MIDFPRQITPVMMGQILPTNFPQFSAYFPQRASLSLRYFPIYFPVLCCPNVSIFPFDTSHMGIPSSRVTVNVMNYLVSNIFLLMLTMISYTYHIASQYITFLRIFTSNRMWRNHLVSGDQNLTTQLIVCSSCLSMSGSTKSIQMVIYALWW